MCVCVCVHECVCVCMKEKVSEREREVTLYDDAVEARAGGCDCHVILSVYRTQIAQTPIYPLHPPLCACICVRVCV